MVVVEAACIGGHAIYIAVFGNGGQLLQHRKKYYNYFLNIKHGSETHVVDTKILG
jgi:hypothetical protein